MNQPKKNNVREIAQSAMRALQTGNVAAACTAFEQIVALGQADASVFLGLAFAHRQLKNHALSLGAVDRALLLEPQNLQALIFKADLYAETGDTRAASAFYLATVKAAPPVEQFAQLPPEMQNVVRRAQSMCDGYATQIENQLRQSFVDKGLGLGLGLDAVQGSRRFSQSLEILFGRQARYVQEPRYYFFPELAQRQFFDSAEFPWIADLEAATDLIRAELLQVLQQQSAFQPYVQGAVDRPHKDQNGMLNNADWSAFYLYKDGEIVAENIAQCPQTMQVLQKLIPMDSLPPSPSILFSQLRPGAHIPAHSGMVNTRLICHLPLIVPPGCTFRVGNEVREWVAGKAWLFDDTIEHEAWNRSDETRVILLFEVWRPELTARERQWVKALFEGIDSITGTKPQSET
jgi:aspartate beta-hydroxylase